MGFGTHDMFLKAKLKYVRKKIGIWRNSYSNEEANLLSQLKERIDQIEEVVESRNLTDAKISKRKENMIIICELERFAKLDLQQKEKSDG